jgi:transcriptional regulator with XRE-family HTH domain
MIIMNTKTAIINFDENLRNIREKKGYTQAQLADISGLSRRMIGHYETLIKRPSIDKIQKLSKALNISTDELLGFHDHLHGKYKEKDTSYRIMKRVRIVEKLPKRDQDMVFSLINTLAGKNKIKEKM